MSIKIKIPHIKISSIILICLTIVIFQGIVSVRSTWIYFLLAIAWGLVAFLEDRKSFERAVMNKAFLFLLIFIFYILITQLANYSLSTAIAGTFSDFLRYVPFVIGMYYIYANDEGNNKFLCYIFLLIIAYYVIKASLYYYTNPGIARYYVSNVEELRVGIGGSPYALATSMNLISLFFLNNCFKARKRRLGIRVLIAVIAVALSFMLCISVDSSIITLSYVICLIISVINIIFFRDRVERSRQARRVSYIKMVLSYGILVALVFLFANNIASLLSWLSVTLTFGGEFLIKRLQQISIALQGAGFAGTTVEIRFQFMRNSIRTFINYPIFGVKLRRTDFPYEIVGRHSEVLDVFAYYGLFASFLYLSYYYAFKNLYKISKTNSFIPILLCLFLGALFNPMHYPQAIFTSLVIVPLLIHTFGYSDGE